MGSCLTHVSADGGEKFKAEDARAELGCGSAEEAGRGSVFTWDPWGMGCRWDKGGKAPSAVSRK